MVRLGLSKAEGAVQQSMLNEENSGYSTDWNLPSQVGNAGVSMKITNFAIIVGLLLVATVGPANADDNRASQILTKNVAEQLAGGSVSQQTSGTIKDTEYGNSWASSVTYDVKSSGATLGVNIRHSGTANEAKQKFEQSKAGTKGETVSGIGESAFRTKMPAQLHVLKGKNYLIITAGTFRAPDTSLQEKAGRELANRVSD